MEVPTTFRSELIMHGQLSYASNRYNVEGVFSGESMLEVEKRMMEGHMHNAGQEVFENARRP